MFDNETPLIAWLAVGSVYVVEGLSKQVSILRYGPLHWKAVIYHYLHWEEAGAFYRGDCRLNNKTHNIHLSIPTYEALQHRNLSSTGSRITNQVKTSLSEIWSPPQDTHIVLFEGGRRARGFIYLDNKFWDTWFSHHAFFLEVNDKHTDNLLFIFLNFNTLSNWSRCKAGRQMQIHWNGSLSQEVES